METKSKTDKARIDDPARNPDPITKAPGSHPVGTGIGAAAGGAIGVGGGMAAGAMAGGVAGPAGAAVGAVVGGVAGGLIGKGVAEKVNPTLEHNYWREHYSGRPYVVKGTSYEQYAPAYQYGWEARARNPDARFEDVEEDLSRDWDTARGQSPLDWNDARSASRDAWNRIDSDKTQPE
jgi:hypothetical protein